MLVDISTLGQQATPINCALSAKQRTSKTLKFHPLKLKQNLLGYIDQSSFFCIRLFSVVILGTLTWESMAAFQSQPHVATRGTAVISIQVLASFFTAGILISHNYVGKKKKKLQPFPDTVRHMIFGWVGNAAFIGVCICILSENILSLLHGATVAQLRRISLTFGKILGI